MASLYADLVVRNARVRTLDARGTVAGAVAVRNGRIVALGTNGEVEGLRGPSTRVIDLAGATLLPGFHDAHCHIIGFALSLQEVDLMGARSVAELVEAVGRRAAQTPPGRWVLASRYDQNKLAEGRHPTRQELDAVSPENPVWVQHTSYHMGVANSLALRLAGVTRDTPDPEGGRIVRDAQGEPTGLMQEHAQELVLKAVPPPTLEEVKRALAHAGRQMAREGITSAQDALAGTNVPEEFRAYQEASAEGLLPQRIWLMVSVEGLPVEGERLEWAFGLHTGFGTDRLRLGAVKFMTDGSLIGRTAALSRPYQGQPDNAGFLLKEPGEFARLVRAVHRAGWQVAMHAIGDRAIEVALDCMESAMGRDAGRFRPRIEHCGILRPDLIERIRRMGVVVVTQPHFIYQLGDGFRSALGEERLRLTYPLATLRGIPVAFSSDRPVIPGAPLLGVESAVVERTASGAPYVPGEALTVEEALRCYTLGGAFAAFAEAEIGTLEVGKRADMVALEEDPLTVEPERLGRLRVVATFIDGGPVYGPA